MSASTIRAQLLKSNKFRSRIVEVSIPSDDPAAEPATLKVKIRQPSVEERNAIFSDAKVAKDGSVSAGGSARTGALAIIYCARDPETDEPVFAHADLDSLLQCPAGGWVDFLSAKVMEVLVEAQDIAKK